MLIGDKILFTNGFQMDFTRTVKLYPIIKVKIINENFTNKFHYKLHYKFIDVYTFSPTNFHQKFSWYIFCILILCYICNQLAN